ncbi:DNA-3-methyladenine glycosylase-like [Anneissia japonica]|uniref:DNA-3-methyladenine glycosylase-like n=1 Tax=Anneissia japonica TaxID=1529436 RepID=UPI001425A3B3|nr:DNA-3-methyladenine glycosylase-like [Anneissia japonica]
MHCIPLLRLYCILPRLQLGRVETFQHLAMSKQAKEGRPSRRQAKKRKNECELNAARAVSRVSKHHAPEGNTSKYFSNKTTDEKRLGRDFFSKPCVTLAKELLGKTLIRVLDSGEKLSGTIVETEAYCGKDDTACHSYKGRRTDRNKAMFMEPGTTYVYLIYGMYCCLNISSEGEGNAVLIRALETIEGLSEMQVHRQRRRKETSKPLKPHQLCSGPGKLTDALHITKSQDQTDLVTCPYMWIENGDVTVDSGEIVSCPRIGLDSVEETWRLKLLRFYICGNKCVSVKNKEAERQIQGI